MTLRARRSRHVPEGWSPPRVVEIRPGSPCDGKVRPGDLLLEINGKAPLDILDYMEACEGTRTRIVLSRDGARLTRGIRKLPDVPLGLVFEEAVFDGVRICSNHCIFCFVDQMPEGLRSTLYVKDDDYRLSFYFGNFITLNNLTQDDVERITRLRLSPLYVSLHSCDAALRGHIMGGDAEKGLRVLKMLLEEDLEIHLQVVVCPGVNSGKELRRTLDDVLHNYTASSLGVVPVGLTSRASALPREIVPHDRDSAKEILDAVAEYQKRAMTLYGRRIFHAADEFYLLAEREFPPRIAYEDYPQLENGIGMARKFLEEIREESARFRVRGKPSRGVLTGVAGAKVIAEALGETDLHGVEVIRVENGLMGASVTVSALLGGGDIVEALRVKRPASRELLIPDSMLREGSFLDDLTPDDVEGITGYRLVPVEVEGGSFLRALYGKEKQD